MRKRCLNPNTHNFKDYGERGIKVCDRWLNSFENFLADMGERPNGMTIDRINPNGDYEAGNCRWATPQMQARNRRNSITVEYRGRELSLTEYAEVRRVKYCSLFRRMKAGMTPHEAADYLVEAGFSF